MFVNTVVVDLVVSSDDRFILLTVSVFMEMWGCLVLVVSMVGSTIQAKIPCAEWINERGTGLEARCHS